MTDLIHDLDYNYTNRKHLEIDQAGEVDKISIYQQNKELMTQEFNELLKNQYRYLYNLGYDYLNTQEDFNLLNSDILIDMLEYVDEKYISILYLDKIKDDDDLLFYYGRNVYKFIFVDFYNNFLDSIRRLYELETNIEIDDIKNLILNKIDIKLDYLNSLKADIKQKNEDTDLNEQTQYYMFCLELMDNDLMNFKENYIDLII